MTTPYAGVDSFPATIPLPQDNVDKRSAAVMNPCWQGCFDAAKWCQKRTPIYDEVWSSDSSGTSTGDTTYTGDDDIVINTGVAVTDADKAFVIWSFGLDADSGGVPSCRLAWQIGSGGGIHAFAGSEFACTAAPDAKLPTTCIGGELLDTGGAASGTLYIRLQVKTSTGNGYIRAPWACSIRIMRPTA